jgi:carbon storage regulator
MLCLTRRPYEIVHISDEITITILGIKGNQVSFGIEAPANMVVLRKELLERMPQDKGSVSDCGATDDEQSLPDSVASETGKSQPKIIYKRRANRRKRMEV